MEINVENITYLHRFIAKMLRNSGLRLNIDWLPMDMQVDFC